MPEVTDGGTGSETSLERAERRFAQARAQLQALRNRESTKARKLDTRRKVILGGALVDLAARDDRAAEMLERLVRNLVRKQDRTAFVGWDWREDGKVDGGAGEAGGGAEAPAPAATEARPEGGGAPGVESSSGQEG